MDELLELEESSPPDSLPIDLGITRLMPYVDSHAASSNNNVYDEITFDLSPSNSDDQQTCARAIPYIPIRLIQTVSQLDETPMGPRREVANNGVHDETTAVNSSPSSSDDQQTCTRTTPYMPVRLVHADSHSEKATNNPRKRRRRSYSSSDLFEDDLEENLYFSCKKRKNFCPFCEKLISNFSRHLVSCHKDKAEVKEYIDLSNESPRKRKQQRAAITNKIKNKGNNIYNKQIVEGVINSDYLPVKRSSHQKHVVDNSTHVVCKHCLGFFKKDSLWRHIPNCSQYSADGSNEIQDDKKKTFILPNHSELMVKDNKCATELLKRDVFPKMQNDAETLVVQGDSLITKYGSNLRFTHRTARQIHYCSSRMRTLARLFLTMKKVLPEIKEFRDCINPKYFSVLVDSVRQMSSFDNTNGRSKAPSVPPRLCSSLKRCANIIKSDAIKDEYLTREQKTETMYQMNDFLFLMDKDWATEVGSNCENSRKHMKVIKKDLLPDPDDIRTFSKYINDMCPLYISRLKQIPNVSSYEKLAKLIIVHIITLNRRRPNETVEITLEAYLTTLNKRTSYGNDIQSVLSEEEINSGKQLSIFYISANKNLKKVPTLLTKLFHKAVDVLIESRDKLGITSKYLFGRLGNTELFDGSAVLKEIANKANLKSPSTFTANSLRHHAATSSQLHSRNDTFTKRLSQFMGHDLKTHEQYYEMPLPLVQKYLVGHRLLGMTLPESSRSETVTSATVVSEPSTSTETSFSFDNNLNDDSNISASTSQTDTSNTNQSDSSNPSDLLTPLSTLIGDLADDETQSRNSTTLNYVSQSDSAHVRLNENHSNLSDSDEYISRESTPKKKHKKVRWSSVEKTVVYEKFGHHFILNTKPTRKEIKLVWEKEKSLENRSLEQVVTYINNIVTKKQQILTPIRSKIKNMVSNGREKLSP